MIVRLIGACFIILGCGGFGVVLSRNAKNEINALQNFLFAIEYMECELKYRMTPLPNLCLGAASISKGIIRVIFGSLGKKLMQNISPNVSECMNSVLKCNTNIPPKLYSLLINLGERLGKFDLDGQVHVLTSIHELASIELKRCQQGNDIRSRSYKTIALCAGAAMVILLI